MPKEDEGGKILSFTRRIEARILRYNRETGFSGSPQDQEILDLVRALQEGFQRTHCPSCARYNPHTRTYLEAGHLNNPADCRYHWTDIVGQCWNHRPRQQAATAKEREEDCAADRQLLELLLQSIRPL